MLSLTKLAYQLEKHGFLVTPTCLIEKDKFGWYCLYARTPKRWRLVYRLRSLEQIFALYVLEDLPECVVTRIFRPEGKELPHRELDDHEDLAFHVLEGDPVALDLVTDVLQKGE